MPSNQIEKKDEIVAFIKKVGCIQLDPLDQVRYNSHLVLQSRVKKYSQKVLDELLYKDRKLLDGWDKNMSIYSIDDRKYSRRYRERARKRLNDNDDFDDMLLSKIRERIDKKGLISSLDLEYEQTLSFLAPLDNLLWDRKLIKRLFNFEYVWEVYKPVSKRKYGYYILPILYGDRFIGRFEPTFDKKTKTLLIKNWWWEEDVNISTEILEAMEVSLYEFLKYLNGDKIVVADLEKMKWLSEILSC